MNALIEKMKRVELSISSELGPFELFALFQLDTTLRLWDILIAAEWVERDELAAMHLIANQMNKEFTAHEIVRFSGFVVIPLAYEGLRKFQSQMDVEHGEKELRNVTFFDVPILHAYIITSHHTGTTRMINRPTRVKQN